MTTLTSTGNPGAFLVSEANGLRSRSVITVLSGEELEAGHVVGAVTLGAGTSAADAGNTGNGTMGAITVGATAQVGDYVLTVLEAASDAGLFQVVAPDNSVVGLGTVAVAFSGGGLSFTLADGATDFAVGDFFVLSVAAGSGKYVEWNVSSTDGSQNAAGVLFEAVDASSADAPGVLIDRDAEINADEITYFTGASAGNKATALASLAALGIKAR